MIYFAKPRGRPFVKIGYARCVRWRVEELQTANPDELIILGVIAGGLAKEAEIHARFVHLWIRGEWFRYTRELRRFLEVEAEDYQPDVHDPSAASTAGEEEWKAAIEAVQPSRQEGDRRVVVWVARFPDRKNLVLQWFDPGTRKRKSKTAGTSNRDEAELRRADLEAALNFLLRNSLRNTNPVSGAPAAQVDSENDGKDRVSS